MNIKLITVHALAALYICIDNRFQQQPMKNKKLVLLMLISALTGFGLQAKDGIAQLKWVKEVGAHTFPKNSRTFCVNDFGAAGDAVQNDTKAIQHAIDSCASLGGGKVTFRPGIYLTGSIFVKSNINLEIPKGTTLIGSQLLSDYKTINTRVAGVEMPWPAALLNVIGQKNAAISGDGVVNGRGKVFWDKYWSMREQYNPKGLRWIVDYDCERPRGILVSDCENVTVKGIVLYQPGFWSLHVLYSQSVTVDGVIISNNIEGFGPSTDGIDIDSSSKILVQNCYINCNDDNFCLKSGRDADGLRVNRPCEYVVIRDCVSGYGGGLLTCGSETSGGIRNIAAYNLKGIGTKYGLRFKSTLQRGGVIENIYLSDIFMDNVAYPLIVDLNWHPAYSNSLLPKEYNPDSIPVHWKKMLENVSAEKGTPKFRNIYFEHIKALNASTCLRLTGIEASTMDNFAFEHITLEGKQAGNISWARNWSVKNMEILAADKAPLILEENKNVTIH